MTSRTLLRPQRKRSREVARARKHFKYDAAIAEDILVGLAEGRSLRAVCARPGMPDRSTVYRWLLEREDLREKYAAARAWQVEHWAEEIIAIVDRLQAGRAGMAADDSAAVARAKLRADARRWLIARLAPRKYGAEKASSGRVQRVADINIHFHAPGDEPPMPTESPDAPAVVPEVAHGR